jgi:hypothetical protein
MTFIHSYIKECIINKIDLPFEILNIIKSYIFHTFDHLIMYEKIKKNKKRLMKIINEASFSNYQQIIVQQNLGWDDIKIQSIFHPNYWKFVYRNHYIENLEMEGINCCNCGEYIVDNSYNILPYHICCHC